MDSVSLEMSRAIAISMTLRVRRAQSTSRAQRGAGSIPSYIMQGSASVLWTKIALQVKL